MTKTRISGFGLAIGLLLIMLVACLLYVIMSPEKLDGWQIGGDSRIYDSSAGGDGTLYLMSCSSPFATYDANTSISALSSDGSIKWERPLSEIYPASNSGDNQYFAQIMGTDEDSVYVLIDRGNLKESEHGGGNFTTVLAAVSSGGQLRWIFPISRDNPSIFGACSKVYCVDRRIYFTSNLTEYILDKQGNVVTKVDLVRAAAVGPDGNFYVSKVASAHVDSEESYVSAGWKDSPIFEGYSADGTLRWERNLSEYPVKFWFNPKMLTLHDNTLYVLLENGVLAMDCNGKTLWVWQSGDRNDLDIYYEAPFDSEGNIFLYTYNSSNAGVSRYNTMDIYAISRDGKLVRSYTVDDSKKVLARDGRIVYHTPDIDPDGAKAVIPETVNSLSRLQTITIRAHDPATEEDLWSFKLPVTNITTVTVTPDNVEQLFPYRISWDIKEMNLNDDNWDNWLSPYHDVFNKTPTSILSLKEASALVSGDILYVNLYTYAYETPTEYNKSRCAYASTLYAISKNGTLLWQKPTDRNIYWMAAGNNSTVYYSTTDGRIFTTAMYVAGGLTVAAILYTIAHFLGAGTVARARSRLGANENRNAVCKYIAGNPGSTMRDISRGLGMNLGTVRYHLLILGLNHKIASYQADGKHTRYFVNSGAYTGEEQQIISIVRREGMRKVLECLLQYPGQTNKDISASLDMRESAVSRYTGELVSAGLIEKTTAPGSGVSYSIKDGARDAISSALGLLPGTAVPEDERLKMPRVPED